MNIELKACCFHPDHRWKKVSLLLLSVMTVFFITTFTGCKGCNESNDSDKVEEVEGETPVVYPVPGIYVSTSGSDTEGDGSKEKPYATITKAVEAAEPGESIGVAAGTYNENITIDMQTSLFGGWNTDFTERDCVTLETIITDTRVSDSSPNYAITFTSGNITRSTTIDGFTINAGGGAISCGIYCDDSACPTIENCVINGGSGTVYSIGISVNTDLGAEMMSCPLIKANVISGGSGGSASYGIRSYRGTPEINGNSINGGSGPTSIGIHADYAGNSYYINNTIHGGSGSSYSIGVNNLDASRGVFYLYNTIDGGTSPNKSYCIRNVDATSTPNIRCNILINSGTLNRYGIENSGTTSSVSSSCNCTYISADQGTDYGTTDGNVKGNPALGGDGMHLTADSPVSVTEGGLRDGLCLVDKEGTARTVPPSMGAYEADIRPGTGGASPYLPIKYVSATTGSDDTGSGSLTSPYATIGKALSAAKENDEIRVAMGTYEESLVITTNVKITGGYTRSFHEWKPSINATILQCVDDQPQEGSEYVTAVTFTGTGVTNSAVLRGFRINGTRYIVDKSCAVLCTAGAAPVIDGNTVNLGFAPVDGLSVGILCESGSDGLITNNYIVSYYSAQKMYGLYNDSASPTVFNNVFRNAYTYTGMWRPSTQYRCFIYNNGTSNAVIVNNTVASILNSMEHGHYIYVIYNNWYAEPVIKNNLNICDVKNYSDTVQGNTIYIFNDRAPSPVQGGEDMVANPVVENNYFYQQWLSLHQNDAVRDYQDTDGNVVSRSYLGGGDFWAGFDSNMCLRQYPEADIAEGAQTLTSILQTDITGKTRDIPWSIGAHEVEPYSEEDEAYQPTLPPPPEVDDTAEDL